MQKLSFVRDPGLHLLKNVAQNEIPGSLFGLLWDELLPASTPDIYKVGVKIIKTTNTTENKRKIWRDMLVTTIFVCTLIHVGECDTSIPTSQTSTRQTYRL